MLLFEEEPAVGLVPLILFVFSLDDIMENRAESGLHFDHCRALACEASALTRRFDKKREPSLYHLIHLLIDSWALRLLCQVLPVLIGTRLGLWPLQIS